MKKVFSLCLACTILSLACASCSAIGLTLPSAITTPQAIQTSLTSLLDTSATTPQISSVTTSNTTQATTVATQRPPSPANIKKITYLDFRPEMNKWSYRDAGGKLIYTSFTDKDFVDENGTQIGIGDYYPFALYHENFSSGLKYEFRQNEETLKLTAMDANNPRIAFNLALLNVYQEGNESDKKIEYVKIRFKNNSSATKLTFMGSHNSYSVGRQPDPRVSATIDILPNSDEWQTITISMVEGTKNNANNTTKANTWNSYLKHFAIFPFGYGADCEATVGAEMEIDYVVIGSFDFVTAYQSELERLSH